MIHDNYDTNNEGVVNQPLRCCPGLRGKMPQNEPEDWRVIPRIVFWYRYDICWPLKLMIVYIHMLQEVWVLDGTCQTLKYD